MNFFDIFIVKVDRSLSWIDRWFWWFLALAVGYLGWHLIAAILKGTLVRGTL